MAGKYADIGCSIVGDIHRGGMARLYLGVDEKGNRVVFRELLQRNVFHFRLHRGFVNGTRIRELLSPHPNIVHSIRRGRRGMVPYEVIEHIPGLSIRRLMQQKDECLCTDALDILRQSATALAHMHSLGYIHLDIKPENFLVHKTKDGLLVKLTDFDLSRDATLKRTRRPSGTVAYMAPEQIKRHPVGPQADIFAFGIMAYQVLTGKMPFIGKHEKQLRWRQCSDKFVPKPPTSLNPELTPKIDEIVCRCLEKRPEERFPTMEYLCDELQRL